MRHLGFLGLSVLGAALVGLAVPNVDATRQARQADDALLFVPSGDQLQLGASGFEEAIADVLWVRAVLIFGERYDRESGDEWNEWLLRTVRAVNTLNPHWRTAYFYGGALLRAEGAIDGADVVFTEGADHFPDDPFFPFSVGMNAYLYRNDPATAAEWLEKAAARPGAPSWYAAAAAAMHQKSGARETAIAFLRETAAKTDNPAVKQDSEVQLNRLLHNELVDQWSAVCREFRERNGRPLASPAELEQITGKKLPDNPRGDGWIVGLDGVVRSPGADEERLRHLRQDEWPLIRG